MGSDRLSAFSMSDCWKMGRPVQRVCAGGLMNPPWRVGERREQICRTLCVPLLCGLCVSVVNLPFRNLP